MDAILDFLLNFSGGSPAFLLGIFVFLAVGTLAFGVKRMGMKRTPGNPAAFNSSPSFTSSM